jgi:hypothetical protein
MSKIFIRIAAVILTAGLVLAGCENPADGGQEQQQGSPPDISALTAAIEAAVAARNGVAIAPDAEHAPLDSEWVTQEQWNALDTPYETAVEISEDEDATKNEVETATSALEEAIEAFKDAKTTNGKGTGTSNDLIITGLSEIYDDGTEVRVGFYTGKDANGLSGPVFSVFVTVTSGFLTVETGAITGSHYVSFMADDRTCVFVSNTAIAFNGSLISKRYGDNFGLLAHPLELGNEGFTSSFTNLDQYFQSYGYDNYADYVDRDGNRLKKWLVPNLHSLVDCNFYKDPAFSQPYNGTELVNDSTVVYSKIPWPEYRGAKIGQISGSITLTDASDPGRLSIEAGNNDWYSYTGINPSDIADGVLNWTIPLCEFDAGDWDTITGTQEVSFYLNFGFDGNFKIPLGVKSLDMTNKSDITEESLGEVSLGTITLSGSISLSVTGAPVSNVSISVIADDSFLGSSSIKVTSDSLSNVPWSVSIRPFEPATNVTINVTGYDDDSNKIFYKHGVATVPNISTSNKTDITLNIGTINLITLSGTINVTYSGKPVPRVYIGISESGGGSTQLDSPGPNAQWSIVTPALDSEGTVTFNVTGQALSGRNLFEKHDLVSTTVYNSNVPGIVLNIGNVTPEP